MTMAAYSAALEVVANLYDSFLTILLCTLFSEAALRAGGETPVLPQALRPLPV